MEFVWDENKAVSNLRDHGIKFEFAMRVFQDPAQFEWLDDREDYGAERFNVVGLVNGLEVLVTYTLRGADVGLSRQGGRIDMSEKITGEVRFTLDPTNLPTMSEERMAALRKMPDDAIDYSDTPSQAGKRGRRVGGPRFGAPPTVLVLEPDVLQFFSESGGASAPRINAALREYVEAHRRLA